MGKFKGYEIHFVSELTVEDYIQICNKWAKPVPTSDHKWWMHESEFGYFFLEHMTSSYESLDDFRKIRPKLTWRDWHMFIPALKNYFVTHTEFLQIVNNISFIKGKPSMGTSEDPVFNVFMMFKSLGGYANLGEILSMNYKTFFKLYLYTMGEVIIDKANNNKPTSMSV